MGGKNLTARRGSTGLLRTLTDNPALPAYVRRMQAPVLKRLIEHVGVADASSLIVHTSAAQMRDLFDVVLWESLAPGQPENLRPERFREWLEALLDAGTTFAVTRLTELGEPFLVSHLHGLVRVLPAASASEHMDSARCRCILCRLDEQDTPYELIGDYLIAATPDAAGSADGWDSIRTVLLELDSEDARFLERVLAASCERLTVRGHVDGSEDVLADIAGERKSRREGEGFVTPELASVFLKTAQAADLDELLGQPAYDNISAAYFEAVARSAEKSIHTNTDEPDNAEGEPAESDPTPAENPSYIRQLDEALQDAEVITGNTLLLPGPSKQDQHDDTGMELQVALEGLQHYEPALFVERLSELIFISNVLMAGAWFQGERFREADAARAALACANLGLEWLLAEQSIATRSVRMSAAEKLLESAPGIVRLFRTGWHLLQSLPLRAADALIDALQDDRLRQRLARRAWILAEIDSAISEPDLRDQIRRGEFEDVADNLHLLTLILEPEASRCLQIIIADFPRYPLQLDIGLERSPPRSREARFFSSMRHLERVERFIAEIDRYLKVDG